jgi:hypothetical protein
LLLQDDVLLHARHLHHSHLGLTNEALASLVHLPVRVELSVDCARVEQLLVTVDLGLDVASRNLGCQFLLNLLQRQLESNSDISHVQALVWSHEGLQILASDLIVDLVVVVEVVTL